MTRVAFPLDMSYQDVQIAVAIVKSLRLCHQADFRDRIARAKLEVLGEGITGIDFSARAQRRRVTSS
jgi:hypothetical protein